MMRTIFSAIVCAAALGVLPACGFTSVHETVHQSVPVTGSPTVHVTNSVGAVTIRTWDKPSVDIVAEKSAHSDDGLKNIRIDVKSSNAGVFVTTVNNGGGSFWSGGGVGYTINMPRDSSLDIRNDTGGVRIFGAGGNIAVRTTTGGIQADLGTVDGNRTIDMRVVTGGIDVTMANDSSATLDMHTTIGGVKSAFGSNRIGLGTARVHLETTTGGVSVHAS